MHELSIAQSLVQTSCDAAAAAGVTHVTGVHLQLGVLSGVVKDALLFCYDIATEGTPLAGSRLHIEELPVIIRCARCDAGCELTGVQSLRCPRHGLPPVAVVQGRELSIVGLEYED